MKKGLTEMVFILDRSGSMAGLEADTIGGFNSMIKRQKKGPGHALVSTVLFSDSSSVIYDRVDIERIEPMTNDQYYVYGCTALIDAIGGAIHHIGNVHRYAREEDRPEHTVFVITTDGMENASRYYTSDRVKAMVKRQKERYGWEFLFLGANIDAVETAVVRDRKGPRREFPQRRQGAGAVLCGHERCDGRGAAPQAAGGGLEGVYRSGLQKPAMRNGAVIRRCNLCETDCIAHIQTD